MNNNNLIIKLIHNNDRHPRQNVCKHLWLSHLMMSIVVSIVSRVKFIKYHRCLGINGFVDFINDRRLIYKSILNQLSQPIY